MDRCYGWKTTSPLGAVERSTCATVRHPLVQSMVPCELPHNVLGCPYIVIVCFQACFAARISVDSRICVVSNTEFIAGIHVNMPTSHLTSLLTLACTGLVKGLRVNVLLDTGPLPAIAVAGVRTQSRAGGGTHQLPFVVLKVPQTTAVCPLLVFAGFS